MTTIKTLQRAACAVFVIFGSFVSGNAQSYSITDTSITTCTGILYDTGGANGAYFNLENFTTTICPDSSGSRLILNWTVFDLDTSGSQNTWDRIELWDGLSTTATYLGSYMGKSLSGLNTTASALNISGCLTVRFYANTVGFGNFSTSIDCASQDCEQPVAINSTTIPDTVIKCVGDTLILNGSNSLAVAGSMITQWQWNTQRTAPLISHAPVDTLVLNDPGIYILQLQVLSSTNCISDLTEPKYILVSGPVIYSGTLVPETVCIPEIVTLEGIAHLAPFVQNQNSGQQFGPGMYLADGFGIQNISQLNMLAAQPGSIVNSTSELGDICLNMEHSYMGDLIIELECPNGQSVILYDQGGAYTYLGDAHDGDDLGNPTPGTCWEYCFNANPDHGTWVECTPFGITPNVISVASNVYALAPGSYTSVDPLSNLIGCPMNGIWTLTITDQWAWDNGFLCEWNLGLPQVTDSTFISFTGSLNTSDTALTFWTGQDVTNSLIDPANANVTITTLGEHDYTFTVIDSYGCLFDTSCTIIGYEPPLVEAGNDVTLCVGEELLNGAVEFGILDSCSYVLSMRHQSFNGWPSNAVVTVIYLNDTTNFNYVDAIAMNHVIPIVHGEAIQLLYSEATDIPNENNGFALLNANGNTIFFSGWDPNTGLQYAGMTSCTNILPPTASIFWSPTLGLSDPDSAITSMNTPAQGWYTLTGAYPNGCSVSDSVYVQDQSGTMLLSWNASDSLLCVDQSFAGTYIWHRTGYSATDTTSGPCLPSPFPGTYSVIAQPDNGCTYFSDTLVICAQIAIDQYNGNLHSSITTGIFIWTFNGDTLPDTGPSLTMTAYGDYTVVNTLSNGCVSTASLNGVGPVGISEFNDPTPLRIIPNPTNGTFRLQLDGLEGRPCTLELRDITGRLVLTEQYTQWSDPQTIHAEHLNQGTYFVTVVSSAERFVGKLILER